MIAIEVFRKRKRMEPILNRCWPVLTHDMPYPAITDQQPVQKLVYFGQITYAIVYESALVAGMSSSAAHYLARLQLGKCKLGQPVTGAVEATFSGIVEEDDRHYADGIHRQIGRAIEKIMAGDDHVDPLLQELARHFRPVTGLPSKDAS